jgi:hypothetical protein
MYEKLYERRAITVMSIKRVTTATSEPTAQ